MMSVRRMLRGTACALILLTLGACDHVSPDRKSYCLNYRPVYTSPRDTEETRQQCDGNNAVWLAFGCGK